MEGLLFGGGRGAYLRREICVSKLIGLALYHLPFLLCFTLHLRAISKYKPPPPGGGGGAYIWRGDLTEGLLRYEFGELIFGGAYTWRGLFSEFYGIPCHSCQYYCPSLFCFKTTVFYLALIISLYFIDQHLLIILFDKIIRL